MSDTSSTASGRLCLYIGMVVICVLHPHLVLSEDLSVISQSVSWVRCEKCGLLFPCADLHCSESQSLCPKPKQNLGLLLVLLFTTLPFVP